jgi:tRNA(Ile)-lysidine synthase
MLDRLTVERMRAWTGDKPVLLALSGGGDSVALLHLLVAEFGAERLRAAVVDHALRDGSAADAQRAAGFATELGVPAKVLTLSWEEGANRAQQAAREARYRALCGYARREGLNTIAAAHTADDQAETLLMRAANGSTWRGLAGIAPFAFAPIWPEGRGIALIRPLLAVRREALRAQLRDRQAEWIDDLANNNLKYERVRVRERLRSLEPAGVSSRLVDIAKQLRTRADDLDRAALALIQRSVDLADVVTIRRKEWSGADDVRRRALSVLITAAAGSQSEPPPGDMDALEARTMSADHRGSTQSGVEFKSTGDAVYLTRDGGAVLGRADGPKPLPPLELPAGVEVVWDGRIAVTASMPGWRAVPARNRELVAFENGLVHKPYAEVRELMNARSLATERVRHAFAPDINLAKP